MGWPWTFNATYKIEISDQVEGTITQHRTERMTFPLFQYMSYSETCRAVPRLGNVGLSYVLTGFGVSIMKGASLSLEDVEGHAHMMSVTRSSV